MTAVAHKKGAEMTHNHFWVGTVGQLILLSYYSNHLKQTELGTLLILNSGDCYAQSVNQLGVDM